jgi:hypothetical protein
MHEAPVERQACPQSQCLVESVVGKQRLADLNKCIILGQIRRIQCSSEIVIDEELPADGETEDIEPVVIDEMFHLSLAV